MVGYVCHNPLDCSLKMGALEVAKWKLYLSKGVKRKVVDRPQHACETEVGRLPSAVVSAWVVWFTS